MQSGVFALRLVSTGIAMLAAACSSKSTNGENSGGSGGGGAGGAASNCVTVPADVIADFTTDNGLNPADGRMGGFYVYGDMTANATFTPPNTSPYPIDTASGNTSCSGPGSFHVKATGFATWGAALGADFVPKVGANKGTYDASKYRGVSFWAKGAAPISHVQVSFPDVYTDAGADPSQVDPSTTSCIYLAGAVTNCSPYLVKLGDATFPNYMNSQITTGWQRFDILFADTKQDQFNPGFHRPNADYLDSAHLTGMAIQVNAVFAANGTASANDFEIWIDDVAFLR